MTSVLAVQCKWGVTFYCRKLKFILESPRHYSRYLVAGIFSSNILLKHPFKLVLLIILSFRLLRDSGQTLPKYDPPSPHIYECKRAIVPGVVSQLLIIILYSSINHDVRPWAARPPPAFEGYQFNSRLVIIYKEIIRFFWGVSYVTPCVNERW